MVSSRNLSSLLLMVGFSAAAPRWWSYQGPGDLAKQARASSFPSGAFVAQSTVAAQQPSASAQVEYTPPTGGFVSNGILYLTTTIYLEPGQSPPTVTAAAPATSSPALAPAAQAPAPKSSSLQSIAPAVVSSQAPAVQAPAAQPVAGTPSKPASQQPIATTNQSSATAAQQAAASPASSSSSGSITSNMIVAIAPNSASCANASPADECATAAQAAPAFNSAFSKYGISNKGAQAAVIAWEAFESVQFKFKINKVPGNPGQGTRCMMMPNFVSQYAAAVVGASQVSAAGSPAAVLALVNSDDASSFGGGAWYMSTKCPDLMSQFASSPDTAWSTFMTSCVGTTDTAARDALWSAAKTALGVY